VVPDDEDIVISTNKGEPLVLTNNKNAGQAYKNIASRLLGEEIPFMNLSKGLGLMSKIKAIFR